MFQNENIVPLTLRVTGQMVGDEAQASTTYTQRTGPNASGIILSYQYCLQYSFIDFFKNIHRMPSQF